MPPKIVVIARSRNEEPHIERFCRQHEWADKILLYDSLSYDRTVEIASLFPNVSVRIWSDVEIRDGVTFTPEGRVMNAMHAWALEEKADWIVMDDVDSCPNHSLKKQARTLITAVDQRNQDNSIFVHRLYIYGATQWFPQLTGGDLEDPQRIWFSLWAWRASLGYHWKDEATFGNAPENYEVLEPHYNVDYPSCLLHFFCFTPSITERKLATYRKYFVPTMKPWIETCGPLAPLPEWAVL